MQLDEAPFRVGEVAKLVKKDYLEWKKKLQASLKRRNVGGVLLILDGDAEKVEKESFCAGKVAKKLAMEATSVGGGATFSVGVVFAMLEYESWLIGGIESLAGKRLPDGRMIDKNAKAPTGNLEESPRDAKGWFNDFVEGGYKPTRDQAALTDMVDLQVIRAKNLRSFKRLEKAVAELVSAIRNNKPILSPA